MSATANRPEPTPSPAAIRLAIGALVVAIAAAYLNSFRVPFVFDDVPTIVDNPTIRHLWPLTDVLAPQQAGGLTVSGRPIVNLSLAINYAISGHGVWSYHVVNLLIHVMAGLALFGLVRRTLLMPRCRDRFGESAVGLAFAVAAVWALHPLQTESVTYVIQRAESLAGMFYLLTLYAFARAVSAARPARWLVGCVAAAAFGMASKEVAVSAPLIVLLYDRTFVAGTFRAAWQARRRTYLALAATWLLLAVLVLGTTGRGGTAGFGAGVTVWAYALTQCGAIIHYLRLCVWPQPLIFDYGLETVRELGAVLPQALALLALLVTTVWLLVRRPAVGFPGATFFALLAPSSSFVPVVTQTVAEHRMYLPLAAVVALAVLGGHRWLGRASLPVWSVVALAFLGATAVRNIDYGSELSIWSVTAAALPTNARAHNNLGQAQFRAGRVREAMASYDRALALQPRYPETHYNRGIALAQEGKVDAAIASYETALRHQPTYPEAHNNLGNALVRAGRVAQALPHFSEALRLKPDFAEAHNNLGNALLQSNRPGDAVTHFRRALELKPNYPEARYNLGNALAGTGRMADAVGQYRQAIALKPDYAEAHVNAGNASLQLERPADAIAHYEKALALNPRLGEAHFNLGSVLLDAGRWADAAAHFEAALAIDPEWAGAHRALGYACSKLGRTADAIAHLERFLRTEPNDLAVREVLTALRAKSRQ